MPLLRTNSLYNYPKINLVNQLNKDSRAQKNKQRTTIEPKTTMKVCVVSTRDGQTTLLISVLDSRINLTAPFPNTVLARIKRAKRNKATTASTLYRNANSV